MGEKVGIEASIAIAEAAGLANPDVIAAYPITPQTHIVEHLAEMVANGEVDAEYIPVESEHSAMSACLGASAVGARTFTATAGQGLELMHEVLYIVSSMQLPVVMAVANRALSAPINVWGDHSDLMAVRDTGWIQIVVENGQEAVDNVLCAFCIAEDHRVLLPVMIHLDGFHMTHVIEPIIIPDREEVQKFVPPNNYPLPLDPGRPVTMGGVGPPTIYPEVKKYQDVHLRSTKGVILEHWDRFARAFGRQYNPVECYRTEDAKVLIMMMGSMGETAMNAVDNLRNEGISAGLLKLRLWRPFPFEELQEAVGGADLLVVVDRAISFGGPAGPFCSEVKSALYNLEKRPKVTGFVAGLGGRDIPVVGFETMVCQGMEIAEKGGGEILETYGVRE